MTLNPAALAWFETRRGIKRETLEAFGVRTEGRELIFPYPQGLLKSRYSPDPDNPFGLEKEGRQFAWHDASGGPAGAGQVPFLPPGFQPREVAIILEGETDTMSAWQALPENLREKVALVGLSGLNAWKERYVEELFPDSKRVFVVFDRDDPYESADAAQAADKAWRQIQQGLGRRARRVVLPQGINDVAEFFQRYDWAAFQVLLQEAAKPRMTLPRLDLSKDPGPIDWLLEGLVVTPDVTVLWGDGGVSKSMLLMGLAVAIAEGWPTFLGMPLHKHGRVLYVDEENPEDVVLSRLRKLGLTDKGRENLYFVWYGRVRLDQTPEILYDNVMEWDPVMLALDSFSRLQLADEDKSTAINDVFNRGIYPIARELKVPVLALHHANREGSIRGSTAIRNAADLSLEVRQSKNTAGKVVVDQYLLKPDKPRRGQKKWVTYDVVGYDANGEKTDNVDMEERIELQPFKEEETF